MMQHRLVVNKSSLERDSDKKERYSLTYQMTHITTLRGSLIHDDIVDVLGMGVNHWVQTMARDEEEEYKRFENDVLDKELNDFYEEFYNTQNTNNVMDVW